MFARLPNYKSIRRGKILSFFLKPCFESSQEERKFCQENSDTHTHTHTHTPGNAFPLCSKHRIIMSNLHIAKHQTPAIVVSIFTLQVSHVFAANYSNKIADSYAFYFSVMKLSGVHQTWICSVGVCRVYFSSKLLEGIPRVNSWVFLFAELNCYLMHHLSMNMFVYI